MRQPLRLWLMLGVSLSTSACTGAMASTSAAVGPKGGVTGFVYHQSDVQTMPDTPYTRGLVIGIDVAAWNTLRERLGLTGELSRNHFNLSSELYETAIAARADIGENGRYHLQLPPGDHILCLGNLPVPPVDQSRYPVAVNGCTRAAVPKAGLRLDFYVGIGGVRAVTP